MQLKEYKNKLCLLHNHIENNFHYLSDLKKFEAIRDFLKDTLYHGKCDGDDIYIYKIKDLIKLSDEYEGLNIIINKLKEKRMKGIIYRYYIPRSFF